MNFHDESISDLTMLCAGYLEHLSKDQQWDQPNYLALLTDGWVVPLVSLPGRPVEALATLRDALPASFPVGTKALLMVTEGWRVAMPGDTDAEEVLGKVSTMPGAEEMRQVTAVSDDEVVIVEHCRGRDRCEVIPLDRFVDVGTTKALSSIWTVYHPVNHS